MLYFASSNKPRFFSQLLSALTANWASPSLSLMRPSSAIRGNAECRRRNRLLEGDVSDLTPVTHHGKPGEQIDILALRRSIGVSAEPPKRPTIR
jgi:hypothetical protein